MATKRQRANGTWEYVFKKAGVLDKPIYMTFASKAQGDAYEARLMKLLNKGIIPSEHQPTSSVMTLAQLDRLYQQDAHPSAKDRERLAVLVKRYGTMPLHNITARWVDDWIASMKREEKLAPASIRARVGALARCTDWGMRKVGLQFPDQPLRSLPNGYAQYTKLDEALAGVKREDIERDRRLERGEYEKILAMIEQGVLPRKQRPYVLPWPRATKAMFVLGVETAMRMREIYTITRGQVDLGQRTVFLEKTKNGDKRQVPLSSVALAELRDYLDGTDALADDTLIFPFWNGDPVTLRESSLWVSEYFERIFLAAGCEDLGFHDLRHEATSRLFERTTMHETKIAKITGHKSMRMLMRYANLRGSNLAEELW